MPTVLLGNTAVVAPVDGAQAEVHAGGDAPPAPAQSTPRPDLGQQITTVSPPADATLEEQLAGVVGAWAAHSAADPAWVEGDDGALVEAVAAHFGCEVGCPDNGDPDVHNHETWKAA